MAGLKAILFDNDGTLVDTRELILANFREATQQVLGRVYSDEQYLAKVGQPIMVQVKDFSDDPDVQDELVRVFRASNSRLHDGMISAFPGTQVALGQLEKAGFEQGLVTSKRRVVAWGGLELLGLSSFMTCAVGSEDTTRYKPNPDPIEYGCRLLNVSPEECLYVGDAPFDVQAGRAAGCRTAAVTWGMFSEKRLLSENPSVLCRSWDEVIRFAMDEK